MGIRLWVKEQVAKLRRKEDDQQLQAVDGGGASRATPGCSVLFARARKHRQDTVARKNTGTRARSHTDKTSRLPEEDDEDNNQPTKPCVICMKSFQPNTSKYLDFCSAECKTKASTEKGTSTETPSRASEWI